MRWFVVPKGTWVKVHKDDGSSWSSAPWARHQTNREHGFGIEELVVDPLSPAVVHSEAPRAGIIGRMFADLGYYGFRSDGWLMMVPGPLVEIL